MPSGRPTRPLLGQPGLTGINGRFFTDFPLGRPEIWDAVHYKGHVLAADMTGGFYSLRYNEDAGSGGGCVDRSAPVSRFAKRRSRVSRTGLRLRGRVRDRGCGSTRRVQVSVARRVGRRCAFLRRNGRLTRARSCRRPVYLKARGKRRWKLRKRAALPAGRYLVRVRGVDAAGNRERRARKRNVLARRVR